MSDSSRPVSLVFDATAIAAYSRGSRAVGETLIEVDDEHGCVIIPLACLVEAAQATAPLERDLLMLLIANPVTVLIGDDPAKWFDLVEMRSPTAPRPP